MGRGRGPQAMDDMLYGSGDITNMGKRSSIDKLVINHGIILVQQTVALGFRSLPRNLAMGVLRGERRASPVSKYGTKPRPGRRSVKREAGVGVSCNVGGHTHPGSGQARVESEGRY